MTVDVRVVTPEREVWSGDADMVVARGTEGEVGILAGHIPLLLRLAVGRVAIARPTERIEVAVDGGFLHVTSDGAATRVDVLASDAALARDIDVDAVRAIEAEMQERVRADPDDARADAALAWARARIAVRS